MGFGMDHLYATGLQYNAQTNRFSANDTRYALADQAINFGNQKNNPINIAQAEKFAAMQGIIADTQDIVGHNLNKKRRLDVNA